MEDLRLIAFMEVAVTDGEAADALAAIRSEANADSPYERTSELVTYAVRVARVEQVPYFHMSPNGELP